jgi:hypothetical protein
LADPEQASIAAILIIVAPTYHLDGMPADHLTGYMGVDARLIVDKVLVDWESDHQWAACEELSLNFFIVWEDLKRTWLAIIFCIGLLGIDALEGAGCVDVLVGHALLTCHALSLQKVYSVYEEASWASEILKIASDQILRSQGNINLTLGVDAEPVTEHARRGKCPACTAV